MVKTGVREDFNLEFSESNERKFMLSKVELLSIIRYLKKISTTSKGRAASGGAGSKRSVYRDPVTTVGTHHHGVLNTLASPANPAVIRLDN